MRAESYVVPRRGLEPPRLAALVPETSASTNSATWPCAAIGTEPSSHCQSKALTSIQRKIHPVFPLSDGFEEQLRQAGHRLRRLGFPRPPCGAGAGYPALPDPGGGPPSGTDRASAAARPG